MIPELDFQVLERLRTKELFSDITILAPQAGGAEFKLHKVILAASSKYFEETLSKDPAVDKITLPDPVTPANNRHTNWKLAYQAVLDGLYSQDSMKELKKHGLSQENCFAYISVANSLHLKSMAQHISDYIGANVMTPTNLSSILIDATKQEVPDIIEKCYSYMLQDFGAVVQNIEQRDSLLKLPFDKFLSLVSRDDMVLDTEDTVFDLVIKYIAFREQNLENDEEAKRAAALKISDPGAPAEDAPPTEGEKPPAENKADPENAGPVPEEGSKIEAIGDLFSPSMLAEQMMKIMPLSDEEKKKLLLALRFQYISHEKLMKESKNQILAPFRELLMEGLSAKLKSHEPSSLNFQINMNPRMYYASSVDMAQNMGRLLNSQQDRHKQGHSNLMSGVANRVSNIAQQNKHQQNMKDGIANLARGKFPGDQNGQELGGNRNNMLGKVLLGQVGEQQREPQNRAAMQMNSQIDRSGPPPGFLASGQFSQGINNQLNTQQSNPNHNFGLGNSDIRGMLNSNMHMRADPSSSSNYGNKIGHFANNMRQADIQLQPHDLYSAMTSSQQYGHGFNDNYNHEGAYLQEDDEDLLFTYRYDFDESGALFYLGTEGKNSEYINPYNRNLVKVFFSSMGKGSYEDFVGRSLVNCRTLNEPNAFMGIDFGQGRFLVPSCYTIRNRDSSRHIMLNWLFEGSIDFKTWFVLDKRIHKTDDPAYNKMLEKERQMIERRTATSTWSVDQNYLKAASRSIVMQSKAFNGFRYFRIKQISKNSSGADNLALSGFEIYGIAKGLNWRFI